MVNKIREIREKLNLTQRRLAKLVGVKTHTLYCYEAGIRTPSVRIAYKIIAVATLYNLLTEEGEIYSLDDIYGVDLSKEIS